MLRTTIPILIVFILSVAFISEVFAEKTNSLTEVTEDEIGLNSCSKGITPIHVWLVNRSGYRTDFKIPKDYLRDSGIDNDNGGKSSFIALHVFDEDFSPACGNKNELNLRKKINIKLRPTTSLNLNNSILYFTSKKYPVKSGEDKRGFLIYRSEKDQDIEYNRGFFNKELLIPSDGYREGSIFVLCKRLYVENTVKTTDCEATTILENNIMASIYFHSDDLDRLNKIHQKVVQLVEKFKVREN